MSSSAGMAALQGMIGKLRRLGGISEECAPEVAEELRAITAANISAGVGPGGEAWQPTKDGRRPLKNAAAALSATAVGTVAILRLEGPEARHNNGTARGKITRRILPTRRMSAPATAAIHAVIRRKFGDIMGGGAGA
jgi:hypothetical protein